MSERYCTNFRIIYDNDKKMTLEEVTERLNEQQDENKQLKSDLTHELEVSKSLRDVVKSLETEIERLREELRLALN